MFDNYYFLFCSGLLIVFIAIFAGLLSTVIIDNRSSSRKQNQKLTGFARSISTVLITALITILIFWTNIRLTGKNNWFGNQTKNNTSSLTAPTATPDS
jgi:hypothetical protein